MQGIRSPVRPYCVTDRRLPGHAAFETYSVLTRGRRTERTCHILDLSYEVIAA